MTRALLALLSLAACSQTHGVVEPRPADVARPPLTLRFRWPVPATALVQSVSVREEATIASHFAFSVVADEDDQLVLSFHDFAIQEVSGIAPSDFHTVAANMARVVNVASVRPSVRIERSGMSTGLVDEDAALAEMIVARAEDDPVVADQLLAKLAEAHAHQVFVHQQTRPWRHWVESWLGLELYPTAAGYGVVITPQVRARHGVGTRRITARATGRDPAVIELEKRFWVEGEAGRELINAGLEPVFGLLGIPDLLEVRDVTVEASITAVMDVRTLQPRSVRSHLVAQATTDLGVIEHEQLDTYEIEWLTIDEPLLEAQPEPAPTASEEPELVAVPVGPEPEATSEPAESVESVEPPSVESVESVEPPSAPVDQPVVTPEPAAEPPSDTPPET